MMMMIWGGAETCVCNKLGYIYKFNLPNTAFNPLSDLYLNAVIYLIVAGVQDYSRSTESA